MHSTVPRIQPSALSLEESAIYAGLTYPQIKQLIKSGKLPASRVAGRTVVRRAALDRLLHESELQVS